MNYSNNLTIYSQNGTDQLVEIGGIAFLIKYFSVYFPYTFLTLFGTVIGLLGIKFYWKQKLFDDIKLKVQRVEGDKIWLEMALKEKPRLSTFSIIGVRKGKAEDISEQLTIKSGQIINQNLLCINLFYNLIN